MGQDESALQTAFDRGVVRQANALVKSAQTMELNEKRLIMLAMSRIRWGDEEFLTQDIPVTELAQWIGGNPYQEGQKAADGLLHRVVEILEEGGGKTKFQWTTLSAYIPAHKHKAGVACVRIRFNEELSPFLLQLRERYNQIPLTHMLPMPSYNSQRLYEILWHDSHAGNKDFLSYEIPKLKVFIGLRESKGKWEKYKAWKDFKKVLDKAVEDFNEHGNLKITRYVGKSQTKRAYSHVLFHLKKEDASVDPKATSVQEPLNPEVVNMVAELERLGYTQNPFEAVKTYGADTVKRTISLAREAERKAALTHKPIHNVGGLVASMLRGKVAEASVTNGKPRSRLTNAEVERFARGVADAYEQELTGHAETMWSSLSLAQQHATHEQMRGSVSTSLLEFLESVGWQGRGYTSVLNRYLLDANPNTLPDTLRDPRSYAEERDELSELAQADRARVVDVFCRMMLTTEAERE